MNGVVLLSMGGPDSLDAVEPFLANLFSDPLIFPLPFQRAVGPLFARWRAPKARELYARIGGRSPLCEITALQARALEAALATEGVPVRAAFRYWGRTARDAAGELRELGVDRAVAIPMYPHYCRATTLSSLAEMRDAAVAAGLALVEVDRFHAEPGYRDAVAATVAEVLDDVPGAHVVFSAHGVPRRLVASGDPYVSEIEATARDLASRLPRSVAWTLAWQSRVGPIRWTEPATEDVVRELGARGVRDVAVVPLSFVADHVETLEEIDVRIRAAAERAGVKRFRRARALNDAPALVETLARLVRRALRGEPCPAR